MSQTAYFEIFAEPRIIFFEQIKQFKDAIEDDYFFEMLIDDLPVWGYIGEVRRFGFFETILLGHLKYTHVLRLFTRSFCWASPSRVPECIFTPTSTLV